MSPQLQARVVTGGACVTVFHQVAPLLAPQLAQVKVGNATVHGSTATVSVTSPRRTAVFTLQQTGGKWVITNLSRG